MAFLAREDKRIDRRSGVSQRLPITALETAVSNAERRALLADEPAIVPRVADVYAALPAITGKMELEYEGELQGAHPIARDLIAAVRRADRRPQRQPLRCDQSDAAGACRRVTRRRR